MWSRGYIFLKDYKRKMLLAKPVITTFSSRSNFSSIAFLLMQEALEQQWNSAEGQFHERYFLFLFSEV